MIARLGQVLFWAGCIFAALFALFAILAVSREPETAIFFFVCGVVFWLIGRAILYVLAAK